MSTDTFDEDFFETRLEALKDTQEGIQQMSAWCLQHRVHHKKIVSCWLNVFKKVRVEHRLTLFYLANDVIQNSKRKRYEFVESWATALQRATTMVRDEKVKGKILRIFSIWEQREIYNEEYLSDLSGLLNINPPKKTQSVVADPSDDYTNGPLIANIRECVELSLATDNSFKKLPKAPNCDIEVIKQQIKDKSHSDDIEREIERYTTYAEAYSKHLHAEIRSRKEVLRNLDTAIKFYANQRGEVKVVVSAYKNFGSRIKLVKKKLDEITPNLPSPIPSPDINAPSPEPDADLQLPDDQSPISINLFKNSINGYSSYLDGKLPFDINDFKRDDSSSNKSSQPIEVIGSRSDDESYSSGTEYYKPDPITAYSNSTSISIPGLNPLPVPPVESGYTSLARSAQQYGILPPPPATTALFGGNNGIHHDYTASYTPDSGYHGGSSGATVGGNGSIGGQPLMPPPPPMPNLNAAENVSSGNGANNGNEDFNSTWNMNMSWTSLDNSNLSNSSYTRDSIDTPVSPPHFEREPNSSAAAAIEYSEHHTSNVLVSQQDVDHRQLHLPAFDVPAADLGIKLGLSKEKTRQLDIDHRNLISLTGSPHGNDSDKKSWLAEDQGFLGSNSGDVDYRSLQASGVESTSISSPQGLMAPPPPGLQKKTNSPQKSNASSSSDKDDAGSARYDPSDMVIDMDMSDEDLDDILREVNEQQSEVDSSQQSIGSGDGLQIDTTANETLEEESTGNARPALLETPPEYVPQPVWDNSQLGQVPLPPSYEPQNIGVNMEMQHHQPQHQQEMWHHQNNWQNDSNGHGGCVPPPPRPPFPLPFGNFAMNANMRGGRGGGPGWENSPQQNHFRNDRFPRPPRGGGHMGSPYYNRGGGGRGGNGGGMRGGFRGKFRGSPAWH
ncbi:regulation of nuclear pre-mRNA domain-containing protein 2 [Ceratitis capitata]|uniref:regulation of nuclear pre-mRNA domain-containing protein 2 n=1 Tax=Ceratitis capitata TaxID=7213 RepID=UPI00032A0ADF|nr:regulation of nuclear pre-mRNA domain-containing protein 2 [Ceratitis capitata]